MFCGFVFGQKQDSLINRNVTVEREYVPVVQEASKLSVEPVIVEPKKSVLDAKYSDFNSPLSVGGNVHPLSAATLLYEQPAELYAGYARIGIGTYPNSLIDFAYPIVNKPDVRLDAEVHHRSAYNAYFNTINTAKIAFDKNFETFTLFFGLNGGFQGVRYYGKRFNGADSIFQKKYIEDTYIDGVDINGNDIVKNNADLPYEEIYFTPVGRQAKNFTLGDLTLNAPLYAYFWRAGLNLGFRSAENADDLRYSAQIKYDFFRNTAGVRENSFHTFGNLNFNLNENRLGANVDIYNGSYNSKYSINYFNKYAIFRLNPYYEINGNENLKMRLGFEVALPFSGEKGIKFAPDVRLDFKAIPEFLNIYASITGKYKVNTMNDLFYENPYLAPDVRAKNTHTPFDFRAGIVLKPAVGLLLDIFADYSYITNQYYFVNKGFKQLNTLNDSVDNYFLYTNRFDVVYDKSNLFSAGMRVSYTLKDKFNAEIKGIYTKGNGDKEALPWQLPFYDVSFNTSWHVIKDLTLSLTGFYQAGIYAKIGTVSDNDVAPDLEGVKMKNRFDLNLGGAYTYRDWLTFFVKANNLFNKQYDIFYGYEVQGFNFMGGVVLSF
jgi:hypothetical protein